ncbi:MAG TPA: DUF4230 domain-containing protein [Bacteroidales bacterium]|nr:DUF4230 domain-containing protein [Bacteroidales bacterium]
MRKFKLILVMCCVVLTSCYQNDRSIVVSQVKSAAKLATTEFVLNKTILATRDKKILMVIPLNAALFVAYTEAVVTAGIDANKLKKEDIIIDGNSISIKLPAVEVINFSYPFEKYKIDKELTHDEFLNKFTLQEHEDLYRQSELEIRSLLKQIGVVEQTEEKTRALMENLLKNMGYTEVYIEFKESKTLFPKLDLTN